MALGVVGVALLAHAFLQAFAHHDTQRSVDEHLRTGVSLQVILEAVGAAVILLVAFEHRLRFEVIQRSHYAARRTFAEDTYNADFLNFNHRNVAAKQ